MEIVGGQVNITGCMWSGDINYGMPTVYLSNSGTSVASTFNFTASTLLGDQCYSSSAGGGGPVLSIYQQRGDIARVNHALIDGNINDSIADGGGVEFVESNAGSGAAPYALVYCSTIIDNVAKNVGSQGGFGGGVADLENGTGAALIVDSSIISANSAYVGDSAVYTTGAVGNAVSSDGYNAVDDITAQTGWHSTDSDTGQALNLQAASHDSRNPYLTYSVETTGGWLVGHGDPSTNGQYDLIRQLVVSPYITGSVNELWNSTNDKPAVVTKTASVSQTAQPAVLSMGTLPVNQPRTVINLASAPETAAKQTKAATTKATVKSALVSPLVRSFPKMAKSTTLLAKVG